MEPQPFIFDFLFSPADLFGIGNSAQKDQIASVEWNDSIQNPEKRIDSLSDDIKLRWRLDACGLDGLTFFAIPDFALNKKPLRIDLFIPDFSNSNKAWVRHLQPGGPMICQPELLVQEPLVKYILRTLEEWMNRESAERISDIYWSLPFGSRILLNLETSSAIDFEPVYDTEQQWLSIKQLKIMWHNKYDNWPESVYLHELQLQRQLTDTTSIVKLAGGKTSNLYIFKALLQDVKHMYHELFVLLELYLNHTSHPNIMPRPAYVVLQRCRFGGKTGVCGILTHYHDKGTLKNVLESQDSQISLVKRLSWGNDILSALSHISKSSIKFYSDLKPSNITMQGSTLDELKPILIDFEQTTGWPSWSAPEIRAIAHIETAAMSKAVPLPYRDHYGALLKRISPQWRSTMSRSPYSFTEHISSLPFHLLSQPGREKAMVFSAGKLLWCLCENVGDLGCAMYPETLRSRTDSGLTFPQFNQTPPRLQKLIKACTKGASEWENMFSPVILRKGKFYARDSGSGNEFEVQEAVRRWWEREIRSAEEYAQTVADEGVVMTKYASERPTLDEVSEELTKIIETCTL